MSEKQPEKIVPHGDWPEAHKEVRERREAQEKMSEDRNTLPERLSQMDDESLLSDFGTFAVAIKDAWRMVKDDEVKRLEEEKVAYENEILKRMRRE